MTINVFFFHIYAPKHGLSTIILPFSTAFPEVMAHTNSITVTRNANITSGRTATYMWSSARSKFLWLCLQLLWWSARCFDVSAQQRNQPNSVTFPLNFLFWWILSFCGWCCSLCLLSSLPASLTFIQNSLKTASLLWTIRWSPGKTYCTWCSTKAKVKGVHAGGITVVSCLSVLKKEIGLYLWEITTLKWTHTEQRCCVWLHTKTWDPHLSNK